ncbi:MAG: ADP-heptose:LPS heptosyltransferase [Paraglaciecola sp.]
MDNEQANKEIDIKTKQKILLIRMLKAGDVACIGLPALRFFQQKFPDADVHFLSYAQGADLIRLAEPQTHVLSLPAGQWPNELLPAMETFLGLAEQIVGEAYEQIVNLDTAFMPCLLARFLKDAGENLSGNLLNISLGELIKQFQQQSLQPEYVSHISEYMDSTFFSMPRWQSNWWESAYLPDHGYPEFYLGNCCSFSGIDMNWNIAISPDSALQNASKGKKVIALCISDADDGFAYPHAQDLQMALEKQGYYVWSDLDPKQDLSISHLLAKLKASDLVVCKAGDSQWFASAVGCPTLIITATAEPLTLMPDYATDPTLVCPIHAPSALLTASGPSFSKKCLCDKAQDLAESIDSILIQGVSANDDS